MIYPISSIEQWPRQKRTFWGEVLTQADVDGTIAAMSDETVADWLQAAGCVPIHNSITNFLALRDIMNGNPHFADRVIFD